MSLKEWIQGLLIAIIFILILNFCSIIETTYTQKATVIQVKNNIILIEDEKGYIREFKASGFSVGDKIKLTMDNNHTDLINDDRIKQIKRINNE